MVYILLGDGFEEMEAIAPCDILRRGGVETRFVSVGGVQVTGAHGIAVTADCTVDAVSLDGAELVMLPGGMGGVESLLASKKAMELVQKADAAGILIAAICAAPMILARLGVLNGKNAVCYPGLEDACTGAKMSQARATVRDGNVITGRGPGAAVAFGLRLLQELRGADAADAVRGQLCAAD